jgi:hypothetical protein
MERGSVKQLSFEMFVPPHSSEVCPQSTIAHCPRQSTQPPQYLLLDLVRRLPLLRIVDTIRVQDGDASSQRRFQNPSQSQISLRLVVRQRARNVSSLVHLTLSLREC